MPLPWYGLQTPLTLSLILLTGLENFLLTSPFISRNSSTFLRIWFASRFRTQTGLLLPLMKWPTTTGCFCGRGDTVISIWGFFAAKVGRCCLMNWL